MDKIKKNLKVGLIIGLVVLINGFFVGNNIVYGEVITFDNPLSCEDFECVIGKIISALVKLAIPIVVIMVLVGGFQILFSAGNPEKIKTGRKTILYAVLGYVAILLANGLVLVIRSILGA